jgi:hypothetical protein
MGARDISRASASLFAVADDTANDHQVGEIAMTDMHPSAVESRRSDEGGDAACWANRVCSECGRLSSVDGPRTCEACGAMFDEWDESDRPVTT